MLSGDAKPNWVESLEAYRRRLGYCFSTLLVTDVTAQSSLLMTVGDENFIRRIGYPRLEPGIYELRDVVSRKKQIPTLSHPLPAPGRCKS